MVFLLSAGHCWVRKTPFAFCPINFGKYVQHVVLAEQAWRVSGAAGTNPGLDAAAPRLPCEKTYEGLRGSLAGPSLLQTCSSWVTLCMV